MRQIIGTTRQPGNPWLLALLTLALLWPGLLAPTHRHSPPSIAGTQVAAPSALVSDPAATAPLADADACPICRELLQLAAWLTPPPGPTLAAIRIEALRPLVLAPIALARARPCPWRSRAPPLPLPR